MAVSESPGTSLDLLPCYLVNNLTLDSDQCNFVVHNECLENDALDYVYFVYCVMGNDLRIVSVSTVISLIIIFFISLSSIADEFLCPSLLAIAKSLKMSDSLAGVTLLAFGNGSSDIFSSLTAASSGKAELIVSELLGSGIFCLSIVTGLIFLKHDFRLAYRPLLRDTIFYLIAVYFTWYICWGQTITFYYSLAFILIYVIYLCVALGGQAIHSRIKRANMERNKIIFDFKKEDLHNGKVNRDSEKLNVDEETVDWYTFSRESMRCRRRLTKDNLKIVDDKRSIEESNCNKLFEHENNYANVEEVTNIQIVYKGSEKNNQKQYQVNMNPDHVSVNNENRRNSNCICFCKSQKESANNPIKLSTYKDYCHGQNQSEKVITKDQRPNDIEMNAMETGNNIALKMLDKQQNVETSLSHLRIEQDDLESLNQWDDLLRHLNPIDLEAWCQGNLIRKLVIIMKVPILFAAVCTVPVVDYDRKKNNWCKPLNSFHCISIPVAIWTVLARNHSDEDDTWFMSPYNYYVPLLLVLAGSLLAIYVITNTHIQRPPKIHIVFAYAGFIMSIIWVYLLVTEILGLLKTIGIMFNMTDAAIGLAFLAWGNSLGDIVANLALAEAGYPKMAIGASIGAPLLNLLIGFGLSFAISLSPDSEVKIQYTPTIGLLCISLAVVVITLMLMTLIPINYSKKPFGCLLVCIYIVYFTAAICLEFNVIQIANN